jgi:hypothetical protein
MCFRLRIKDKKILEKPLVAKEDIIVYKVLQTHIFNGNKYFSPYRKYPYKRGEHYYQDTKRKKQPFRIFYDGHNHRMHIYVGLHAFLSEKKAKKFGYFVFKMIVPKGAKYYKNRTEIVSTDLIFPHE